MQQIIIEKPYRFIPPHRGNWAPSLIQQCRLIDFYLNRFEGIASHEVRGADKLRASLAAGQGILLAPNHCRYADPIAIGWVARAVQTHVFAMASWHLFHGNFVRSLGIRLCGGFSVYREGVDRRSLDTAIDVLVAGQRPLVVFPEGAAVFRTNDIVQPLLDGVAFLARTAAKRRAKQQKPGVVIHPVAIKYLHQGETQQEILKTIQRLERQLTWEAPGLELKCRDRVERLSHAFLTLKECQFLGRPQAHEQSEKQRRQQLVTAILAPHEQRWFGEQRKADSTVLRLKNLRMKILPRLLESSPGSSERAKYWEAMSEIYVAQQVDSYPPDYLSEPNAMRMLETLERIDEDVNDKAQVQRPLHAVLEVCDPIEVPKERPQRGQIDLLVTELRSCLQSKLDQLAAESPKWVE